MKAAEKQIKALLKSGQLRVTSKEELDGVYGDAGEYTDREFGVALPKRGRPKKDSMNDDPTVGKTVKHTRVFWEEMETRARAHGLSLHEAMRMAISKWMEADRQSERVAMLRDKISGESIMAEFGKRKTR